MLTEKLILNTLKETFAVRILAGHGFPANVTIVKVPDEDTRLRNIINNKLPVTKIKC